MSSHIYDITSIMAFVVNQDFSPNLRSLRRHGRRDFYHGGVSSKIEKLVGIMAFPISMEYHIFRGCGWIHRAQMQLRSSRSWDS